MAEEKRKPPRAGMGRPKGSINKATKELKELASTYTEQALEVLAKIMVAGESETARVSAANSLLDRAHGKPTQTVAGDKENPLVIKEVVRRIVGS